MVAKEINIRHKKQTGRKVSSKISAVETKIQRQQLNYSLVVLMNAYIAKKSADDQNTKSKSTKKRSLSAEMTRRLMIYFNISIIFSLLILVGACLFIQFSYINAQSFSAALNDTDLYANKAKQINSDFSNYFKNVSVDESPITIDAGDIQKAFGPSIEPIFNDDYYDICADDNEYFAELKQKMSDSLDKFITDNEIEINDATLPVIEPVKDDLSAILCDNLSTEILSKAAFDENELKGNIWQIVITALVAVVICLIFLILLRSPVKDKSQAQYKTKKSKVRKAKSEKTR